MTVSRFHAATAPSPWVERFAGILPREAPVLDLACGGGRHTRLLAAAGHPVTAVDIDVSGVGDLRGHPLVELVQADLEDGSPVGVLGRAFGGVVVTNYLHRPLLDGLAAALLPGGVLIYETFAEGNEVLGGRVTNPDFLLRHGELLELARRAGLVVVAYEDVVVGGSNPAAVQRICAVRPQEGAVSAS